MLKGERNKSEAIVSRGIGWFRQKIVNFLNLLYIAPCPRYHKTMTDNYNNKHNKALTPVAKKLRKNMTKEERRLWYDCLSRCTPRFLRQKVIGNYVVDFYCAKAKLVVELDGSQHFEPDNKINDEKRDKFLKNRGLTVVRLPNNYVNSNFKGVQDYIYELIKDY